MLAASIPRAIIHYHPDDRGGRHLWNVFVLAAVRNSNITKTPYITLQFIVSYQKHATEPYTRPAASRIRLAALLLLVLLSCLCRRLPSWFIPVKIVHSFLVYQLLATCYPNLSLLCLITPLISAMYRNYDVPYVTLLFPPLLHPFWGSYYTLKI
jgi:hypothetical protein